MGANKNLYDEESIKSLPPRDFTRLRPQIYCGSTEYSTQLLMEILSNAIDEYRAGNCTEIFITIDSQTGSTRVQDMGQGFIPMSFREDGKTILEASFSVLNTSGKFNDDGVYEGVSLGMYGVGAKLPCYLSTHMDVLTVRDGKFEHVFFKDGIFEKRTHGDYVNTDNDKLIKWTHGTMVSWIPDPQFFDNPQVNIEEVKEQLAIYSCLCPGLTIQLFICDKNKSYQYNSKNGLHDLLNEKTKDKEIIKNRFKLKHKDGKNKINMVMTYTSNYFLSIVPYVNCGLTDKGPHITAIKTIITREFNKFFREKKWLKEKDSNLSGEDIAEGLYIIFDITTTGVAYNAQVKTTVSKIDMSPFNSVIAEAIRNWLNKNSKEVKIIADKAINARKAREAAKKAKDAIRQKGNQKSSILNLPTKLMDAHSKNREECELLISEGDSAAGGLIAARDGETQAIFPIRGKLINLLKNSDEKIFANQEVVNIIKALGLEIDTNTKKLHYDKKKLRYGKIIMCCDADPDGLAIRNLLLVYFWVLCPELIINGHVYAAIPPLFRITTKKNEYIYLKNATELDEYKNAHEGEKYRVNRNKG